jgi:carboxyl-terminal processing protease
VISGIESKAFFQGRTGSDPARRSHRERRVPLGGQAAGTELWFLRANERPLKATPHGVIRESVVLNRFGLIASTAVWFFVLSGTADAAPAASADVAYPALFEIVWRTVLERYFDPTFGGVDWFRVRQQYAPVFARADSAVFYRVINEMLFELGVSHVGVVPPGASFDEPALFSPGSVGIDVRLVGEDVVVTRVDPGSPADTAGVRPGWIVRGVDGDAVEAIAQRRVESREPPLHAPYAIPHSVLRRLYGEPDTTVVVELQDGDGNVHQREMRRRARSGRVSFGDVLPPGYTEFETRLLEPGVGYVRFNCFHPSVLALIERFLRSMSAPAGLILDVRGNPGGFSTVADQLAAQFVEHETLFLMDRGRGGSDRRQLEGPPSPYQGPVVILIDALSTSAAEELAAGLQAMGRALVVGQRSAGADLTGEVGTLPNGATFLFPVRQPTTPAGHVIEGRGVVPDIPVELSLQALREGRDPVLERARRRIEKMSR